VPPDTTDYYLTNKPIGDTYDTVEFGVTKRMSDHWQLVSGFRLDETGSGVALFRGSEHRALELDQHADDGLDVQGVGKLRFQPRPAGRRLLQRHEGRADRPSVHHHSAVPDAGGSNRTTPLVQGNMQIIAEKAGTYYLPAINLINIRVQKEFVIKDTQRLHLMFNISTSPTPRP
jgi:hypothetical protein